MKKETLKSVMKLAWQFVKKNGFSMSEALRVAWMNIKLRAQMKFRIVKFYFQKVDGTLREAYGSLSEDLLPVVTGESKRKSNDTLQVYFDTEKQSFRSFKKANLVRIA